MLISQAVSTGHWKPIQVTKNGPSLLHLLFADDVHLVAKADCSQVSVVEDIMEKFSLLSGLRINIAKLELTIRRGFPRLVG